MGPRELLSSTQPRRDLRCPSGEHPSRTCRRLLAHQSAAFPAAVHRGPSLAEPPRPHTPWGPVLGRVAVGPALLAGVTDVEPRGAGKPWPACLGSDIPLMLSVSIWDLMNRNVTGN